MNTKALCVAIAVWASSPLFCVCAAPDESAPASRDVSMARFVPTKTRVRIEGTSNIDNWQAESHSLTGYLEVDSVFPASAKTSLGKPVSAKADFSVEVPTLKSVEKDGKPFSNKMDGIMHGALRSGQHPQLTYHLLRLELKPHSPRNNASAEFDARGLLAAAGVTNEVSIVLTVIPLSPNQFKVSGYTTINMTDFRVEPPSPKIALGIIHTDDRVKLLIDTVLIRGH